MNPSPALHYTSAIALALAPLWQQSPPAIAAALLPHLQAPVSPAPTSLPLALGDRLWAQLQISAQPSGWLEVHVPLAGAIAWAQALPSSRPILAEATVAEQLRSATELWPVQYTHARCCYLLRWGEAAGLLTPPWDPSPPTTAWPWGDVHATHALWMQSLHLLAVCCAPTPAPMPVQWSAGVSLSQAWQDWYQANPLAGQLRSAPAMVQGALHLTRWVQMLLQVWLEEDLGAIAPTHL